MFLICLADKLNRIRFPFFLFIVLLLPACVTRPPPRNVNDICTIFKQYPGWYAAAKDVERRWKIPVAVQMAIIHQESKFNAHACPPRIKLLKVIPLRRPSTAYGYTQALSSTWKKYKQTNGSIITSRCNFADGLDFVGWYANQAYRTAGVSRADAYSLYLAYHEGVGGYQHKTYLKKPWLISVAKKVRAKAAMYSLQLNSCRSYS